jgi:hypothetical protein
MKIWPRSPQKVEILNRTLGGWVQNRSQREPWLCLGIPGFEQSLGHGMEVVGSSRHYACGGLH